MRIYSELPYKFREWCENNRIPEDVACRNWEKGREYREFVVAEILTQYKNSIGVAYAIDKLNALLLAVRGTKVKFV